MSARHGIRDELMGHLGDVTGTLVKSIVTEIPAYAELSEAQLAEVHAIAEWGIARVLHLWVEDSALTSADVQRFRGIGAARALDGRPLPGVLRAYRLAGSEIFDLVEEAGRSTLTMADVLALSRLWMATIDTLSEALYAGHVAAADRASGDRSLAVADLVDDLLLGRQVTTTGLGDRLRELGLVLGPRVALLVIGPETASAEVSTGAMEALLTESVREPASTTMLRVTTERAVALVPEATAILPESMSRRHWRGCFMDRLLVSDLPTAFRMADHALAHAPERACLQRPLLEEPDAQLIALLTGHRDADPERLRGVLTPLGTTSGDHLLQGLQAYLDTGSAAEAAHRLGVHPQTLRYRLGRIRQLTGRDPRQGWDLSVLEAAVMAAVRRIPTS